MSRRPPRICACGNRVPYGVQCQCQQRTARERRARHDQRRPSASARGYDSKWQLARAEFLRLHPLCRHCNEAPATVVHHIIPHRGDLSLFWKRSNWMPVCKPCHDGPLQSQEQSYRRRD